MPLLNILANFDWATFIGSALGSSAFTAVITFLIRNNVKKTEFVWDYKKYILNRRLKAYESIESCLYETGVFTNKLYGEKYIQVPTIFYSKTEETPFRNFRNKFTIIMRHQEEWHSECFREELQKTLEFFALIYSDMNREAKKLTKDEVAYLSEKYIYQLRNRSSILKKQWHDDMRTLSNIDAFINN